MRKPPKGQAPPPKNPLPPPVNNHRREILIAVVSALVTSIVGIVGYQIFFKGNVRQEAKIQVHAENLKRNPELVNKLRRFQEISAETRIFVYEHIYMDRPNGTVIGRDTAGMRYDVPRIAADSIPLQEWRELNREIVENRYKIPRDVYQSVDDLNQFLKQNPFPKSFSNAMHLERSRWSTPNTCNRWRTLVTHMSVKLTKFEDLDL